MYILVFLNCSGTLFLIVLFSPGGSSGWGLEEEGEDEETVRPSPVGLEVGGLKGGGWSGGGGRGDHGAFLHAYLG